jgi:putative transposase
LFRIKTRQKERAYNLEKSSRENSLKMSYSLDLKLKVMAYLEKGGKASAAAKIFGVSRASIYRWLGQADLEPVKVKRRKRKMDWKALEKDVEENPELRLCDRAQKFGVKISSVGYALKELGMTRKKTIKVQGKK